MDAILKCYRVLGLAPGANPKAVKKAYRDLVKTWHPDRVQGSPERKKEAEEKIKEINLAFERIQELRPNELMAIRLSQVANQAARAASTAPTAPAPMTSPRARPKPRPTPEPPSATARSSSQTPGQARPKPSSTESAPTPGFAARVGPNAWTRFLQPRSLAFGATILLIGALGIGVFMLVRNPPPPSVPEEKRAVPLAELDRMIAQNRAAIPNPPIGADPAKGAARLIAGDAGSAVPSQLEGGNGHTMTVTTAGLEASPPAPSRLPSPSLSPRPTDWDGAPTQTLVSAPVPSEAEEHFQLGLRYATGTEGFEDFAEAVKWYRLAAEAGHPQAQRNLGLLFAAGKGVPQNFTEAEKWLGQAAAQGQSGANMASALIALAKSEAHRGQTEKATPAEPSPRPREEEEAHHLFSQGLRYATGEGVPQDLARAAEFYRSAADAGHPGAQRNLGLLYATGRGVPKNDEEAEKWLRKAAAQGQAGADLASALLRLKKAPIPSQTATNTSKENGEDAPRR